MAAGLPPKRPSVGPGVYNSFFTMSSFGTNFFLSNLLEFTDRFSSSKEFTDFSLRLFCLLSSE